MYECHGWTDKFQLFQFSFSSVAYSQVSLSVRTRSEPRDGQRQTNKQTHKINPGSIQWQKFALLNSAMQYGSYVHGSPSVRRQNHFF
jgi:hypothetical protein